MLSAVARSATQGSPLSSVVPSAGAVLALLQQSSGPFEGLAHRCLEPGSDSQYSWCPENITTSVASTSYLPSGPSPSFHRLGQPHQHQHRHQLQHIRCYRIPYRVVLPKVPYSERSGRAAPRPLPEFEVVKNGTNPEELRWHRSVVRFPPEVSVELVNGGGGGEAVGSQAGRTLVLTGRAGTIRLSLAALDPTGLLAIRLLTMPASAPASTSSASSSSSSTASDKRNLLVFVSPDKARFDAVGAELNKAIRGVMTGYLLGLTVKGVGYRMEPLVEGENIRRPAELNAAQLLRRSRDPNGNGGAPKPHYFEPPGTAAEQQAQSNISFPFNKPAAAVRLKVGYSRAAVYPLPPHIRAFFLKPTLMYLYGVELDELRRVAGEIRAIRKPNPYTGNGIQYLDEVVKIKQRAGAK